MTNDNARWGALAEDWTFFADTLALKEYLLPVVSNPNAKISPGSDMGALGKTPSQYNARHHVSGFPKWTQHTTLAKEIAYWSSQADYGICLRTGYVVCAIDVDIKDPPLAERVMAFISERYKFPIRHRADSSKFLVAFRCAIPAKRVMRLSDIKSGPIIELLAQGQQFIACGTHTEGARYEWSWPDNMADFPVIDPFEVDYLWDELMTEFGVTQSASSGVTRNASTKGDRVVTDDVAAFLWDSDLVLEEGRDGQLFIECPWFDNHSSDNGITQTAYFPPGGRGYQQGHFKCLHAGCEEHTDDEFAEALGYDATGFEALPDEPAVAGAVPFKAPRFARHKKKKVRGIQAIICDIDNVMLGVEERAFCRMDCSQNAFTEETTIELLKGKTK